MLYPISTSPESSPGSVPSSLILRRYGVGADYKYLFTRTAPIFEVGENIIIALQPIGEEYFELLGLRNGAFYFDGDVLRGSTVTKEDFKRWLSEILEGSRAKFPSNVPRPLDSFAGADGSDGKQSGPAKQSKASGVMARVSHWGGSFATFDETWDLSYLPVQFVYNHNNAPGSVSSPTVIDRINDAIYPWNQLGYSDFTFSTVTSTTAAGQSNDDVNVILWANLDPGTFAVEVPNPVENGCCVARPMSA